MVMTAEKRPVLFDIWLDRMADAMGVDRVTQIEAAKLLGKSERMIGYYMEGREIPTDTRLLMSALLDGYRPKPFGQK